MLRVLCWQVRIDVYCVRLTAFKAYVEEMIKRLREALAASLRRKVGNVSKTGADPLCHCHCMMCEFWLAKLWGDGVVVSLSSLP